MRAKAIALILFFYLENTYGLVFEKLGTAIRKILKSKKVYEDSVTIGDEEIDIYYVGAEEGRPTLYAVVQSAEYPPDCSHTWVIGVNPNGQVVTRVRVVEMSCPQAHPTNTPTFLNQYIGKGPKDLARLDAEIGSVAKATGTCQLTNGAVKTSILAAQKLSNRFLEKLLSQKKKLQEKARREIAELDEAIFVLGGGKSSEANQPSPKLVQQKKELPKLSPRANKLKQMIKGILGQKNRVFGDKNGRKISFSMNGEKFHYFYTGKQKGSPTKYAFIVSKRYAPDCDHTWVIGVDALKAKVTGIGILQLTCEESKGTAKVEFLKQYRGRGPSSLGTLDQVIIPPPNGDESTILLNEAITSAIFAAVRLRSKFKLSGVNR